MNAPTKEPAQQSQLSFERYFPTTIAFTDWLDVAPLNGQLKTHIYAWRDKDQTGIERSNARKVGAWHSATDMHKRKEFADFTKRVIAAAQSYLHELGGDPECAVVCDAMWANVSGKYAYNRNHNHGTSLFSGVYYVQADVKNSGRINFYDPREQAIMTPIYSQKTKEKRRDTWSKVFYDPLPGRIIFFPGWLRHDVDANLSDNEGQAADRISISFNFYQRR